MIDKNMWSEDWRAKAYAVLHGKGFQNFVEFSRTRPGATFRELAAQLDGFPAPIQIERLLREEAEKSGNFPYFARTTLVRYLRQRIPLGWGKGENFRFRLSHAFASWSAALGANNRDIVDAVWNEINREGLSIPEGWLPTDTNDQIIDKLFRKIDSSRSPKPT